VQARERRKKLGKKTVFLSVLENFGQGSWKRQKIWINAGVDI